MNDLANRARALHRERGMTAEQILDRSGFLDDNNDPYIPVATIRDWLGEEGAGVAPRQASILPTPTAVTSLDTIQQVEDYPALHGRVARLEARLDRLSLERVCRTLSPARSVRVAQERSSSGSPSAEQRNNNREIISARPAQLGKQMNTQ